MKLVHGSYMAMGHEANKLFESFIVVLIGVVLVPVIYSLATNANVTGATATIISIIPLLFALGILATQARALF